MRLPATGVGRMTTGLPTLSGHPTQWDVCGHMLGGFRVRRAYGVANLASNRGALRHDNGWHIQPSR